MNKIIQSIESDPKPPEETELTKEQVEKFLEELTELTRKHRIIVRGCGCCGSPWLDNAYKEDMGYEYKTNRVYEDLVFTEKEEP